jgi:NADH-quinone oxidoreductase subunit G
MATVYIDGEAYTFQGKPRSLLELCLSLGFDIPYFCWHPALGSVGSCRQCAVKMFRDGEDRQGRIVMSCMTAAADGLRISIRDPEVAAFRARVIEWLMLNHPHDCPVCDEGGECHLQDMTVMTGHVHRRTRFPKRTFRNQDLGPFVEHEMNRCIQCYRCLRFYRDYAGGRDFGVFGWHDRLYFGRQRDGALQSPFSGNLVEVCPTGVFTDKIFRKHYTRSWDLQTAPSICAHCSLGCNTLPGERYGTLRRIRNRYHQEVNGYFLCDRGRYGYEFVNSARRILQPGLRAAGGELAAASGEQALARLTEPLRAGRLLGIGSPRASLEANFALRALVGTERFNAGLAQRDLALLKAVVNLLGSGPCPPASLQDVRSADAVLVLGEDLTNTAPLLDLALRQAIFQKPLQNAEAQKPPLPSWDQGAVRAFIQQDKGPVFIASPDQTALDELAEATYRAAPDDLARLGFAVARALDPEAVPVAGLAEEVRSLAERIAGALGQARRPVVLSGTGCGSEAVIRAAAATARALGKSGTEAKLGYALPECNSLGVALLGGAPLESALEALRAGQADGLIILENDLFRRWDPASVTELVERARLVVVLDCLQTATTARAHVLLPGAPFAETDGTLVNNEGRAQRSFQVMVPHGEAQASWRWLAQMAAAARDRAAAPWPDFGTLCAAMAQAVPALARVPEAAPPAGFRLLRQRVPRQPHRYSGRTAMNAHLSVREPKPPEDPDSPLAFSMEGCAEAPPAPLISRYWAAGWNSVQGLNKFQSEVGGALRDGDPGLRLIQPSSEQAGPEAAVQQPFAARPGRWLILPAFHVFGSEELSRQAPGVASLSPGPYLGLNPGEALRLGAKEGDTLELELEGSAYRLPLRIRPRLCRGVAVLPFGIPGLEGAVLPAWGSIRAERGQAEERGP